VQDWPGKVTIRRFSPYKNEKIEGEGATEVDAWKSTADKIRAIWNQEYTTKFEGLSEEATHATE
jgi:hypothetical protein